MTAGEDPRRLIAAAPMSAFQVGAVALMVALNALDGFDVLAINFASPGIAHEWGIDKAALGLVKSTGLIGMAAGSLLIAPLADRFGRRRLILACLAILTVGMALTATAHSIALLSVWRVVTGLGIGGMLASINAMTAEYANARRRHLCVSLVVIGYPLGAVAGGLVATRLLAVYDWRSVFVFGSAMSALAAGLVWTRLPESIEWLIGRGPGEALGRVNAVLARMGRPAIAALPAPPAGEAPGRSMAALFAPKLRTTTLLITAAYFCHVLTFYYVLNWIPDIVADLGYSPSKAAEALVWVNVGGAAGGATLGWLTHRFGLRSLTICSMAGTALLVTAFGLTPDSFSTIVVVASISGFFSNAAIGGLYALMARDFPVDLRASGTGLAVGVGRVGGFLAPILPGLLFNAGLGRDFVSPIMAAGAAAAALILLLSSRAQADRQQRDARPGSGRVSREPGTESVPIQPPTQRPRGMNA